MFYLNTSNVNILPTDEQQKKIDQIYLNTSNVNVLPVSALDLSFNQV